MLKMREERNSFMSLGMLYREICFDGVCLEASVRKMNWGGSTFPKVSYYGLPQHSRKVSQG